MLKIFLHDWKVRLRLKTKMIRKCKNLSEMDVTNLLIKKTVTMMRCTLKSILLSLREEIEKLSLENNVISPTLLL